ncbi:1,4-alpha-glucan-branching enzyme [Trema orientale]|uniref:1,4-alpha-glucan-branching enzyme n=1 Tax=Trema orientale TaxID=63057 RepID=A0A2P5FN78_TREOI|nr:1,4-alpha-glucan-branching enzyme [Trema orientale]
MAPLNLVLRYSCLVIVVFYSTVANSLSFIPPCPPYCPPGHPFSDDQYPSLPTSPATLSLPESPGPAPESFLLEPTSPVASDPLPVYSPGPAPETFPVEPTSPIASDPFPVHSPGPAPESFPVEPLSPAEPPLPVELPVPDPDYHKPVKKPPVSHPYYSVRRRPRRGVRAAYWPSFGSFAASAIDTSYFTHIYYAFLLPEPETYRLNITSNDLARIPEIINSLRARYPPVKTLLSIGGGGNDPKVFSKMASSRATRRAFIGSTIEVARRFGFDGVDLDWEFPANDEDMENLALLYKEWRGALTFDSIISRKPSLLLTSAVYFASRFLFDEPRSYPGQVMSQYLDWVSPMCFDYHGSWENFTGLQSALYDPNSNISTVFGIRSWLESGIPAHKIVMGLPMYGRTWKLKDPNVSGVGAPAVGVGPGEGVLVYYQIVDFNKKNKAVVAFDWQAKSFYSYAGDSWVGYEDVDSIGLKVRFAKTLDLGGYFFWALGQDKEWALSRQASNTWNGWR